MKFHYSRDITVSKLRRYIRMLQRMWMCLVLPSVCRRSIYMHQQCLRLLFDRSRFNRCEAPQMFTKPALSLWSPVRSLKLYLLFVLVSIPCVNRTLLDLFWQRSHFGMTLTRIYVYISFDLSKELRQLFLHFTRYEKACFMDPVWCQNLIKAWGNKALCVKWKIV